MEFKHENREPSLFAESIKVRVLNRKAHLTYQTKMVNMILRLQRILRREKYTGAYINN